MSTQATNTTQYYSLSQWEPEDLVRREDFNADHLILDSVLHDKADLTDLAAHEADHTNPHAVTAAQLDAVTHSELSAFTGRTDNPHAVTAAQTGAYYPGGATVAVADGGTGGATAAAGMSNLLAGLSPATPAPGDTFPFLSALGQAAGCISLSDLGAAMGLCRIQYGTYTGTGNTGSTYKVSIALDFTPRIFIVSRSEYINDTSGVTFAIMLPSNQAANSPQKKYWFCDSSTTNTVYFGLYANSTVQLSETGIEWWTTNNAAAMMNTQNRHYSWVALG